MPLGIGHIGGISPRNVWTKHKMISRVRYTTLFCSSLYTRFRPICEYYEYYEYYAGVQETRRNVYNCICTYIVNFTKQLGLYMEAKYLQ